MRERLHRAPLVRDQPVVVERACGRRLGHGLEDGASAARPMKKGGRLHNLAVQLNENDLKL